MRPRPAAATAAARGTAAGGEAPGALAGGGAAAQRNSQHTDLGCLPALLQLLPPPIALPLPPMLACNPHQLLCLFSADLSLSCFPPLWLPHIPICCNTSSAAVGVKAKCLPWWLRCKQHGRLLLGAHALPCKQRQELFKGLHLGPLTPPLSPQPVLVARNVCYKNWVLLTENKSTGCEKEQTESGEGHWDQISNQRRPRLVQWGRDDVSAQ